MTRPRKHIGLKTKLAAALRELAGIPYDHAKLMSEDHIISLFHFDHTIYHSQDGADAHYNLTPMLIEAHRVKTRTVDVPQIAKTKRISKKQEEFRALMLTPRDQRPPKKSRWPSRPFNHKRRKMK